MSWKPEVDTGDGVWVGNALRFATKEEAEGYLSDLSSRWLSVRSTRAVECDLPVTYRWIDGKAEYVYSKQGEIERSQARLAVILGENK